jgi:hypothetical protein
MGIRIVGDSIVLDFCTHSLSTGALSDADSTPTCEVYEGTNDTPIATPTVTKRTAHTGHYRVTVATAAFTVGNSYIVAVQVVMGGITKKKPIAQFTVDSKRLATLNDISVVNIEASTVLAKQAELLRALGLAFENYIMDAPVYVSDQLTSCRLRVYDSAVNVGTGTGVVATYTVTVTYIGALVDTYKVVKV